MNINENFAENLSFHRKAKGLTQLELANKLNYSDKSISKWERAEGLPDVCTLKQIADFFGLSVDEMISEPKKTAKKTVKNLSKKRLTLCLCSAGLVWLVAICSFAFIDIIFPSINHTWLSFIYAVPITSIVLLVFTSVWGKSLTNVFIISILVWTAILSVFLSILVLMATPPTSLWEIFLIGVPLQGLIVFWFLYKKVK